MQRLILIMAPLEMTCKSLSFNDLFALAESSGQIFVKESIIKGSPNFFSLLYLWESLEKLQ